MDDTGPGTPRQTISTAVSSYALGLHAAAGDTHHIVSPLGAWILLALVAPLATGRDRDALERVLGCSAGAARAAADELLGQVPPALALAVAAWHRGGIGAVLDAWRRALPPAAHTGPIPSQAKADAWVRQQTHRQIASIPVELQDEDRLVLASAIATDVPWNTPFALVPAAELGGAWASRVTRVMRRYGGAPVKVVARTEAAGLVGVSHERGGAGLEVVSVIAAPDVPASRVLMAAYDVAAGIVGLPSTAVFVPAFELPLTGHAWCVRELELELTRGAMRQERSEVTIPAWSARTDLRRLIASPGTGFAEIAQALLAQLPDAPSGNSVTASQSAVARFDTNGFSAAALTIMVIPGAEGPRPPFRAIERTVEVRFDRPFAAVAVMKPSFMHCENHERWRGLPAFGAWVTEPAEPSEVNASR